MSRKSNCWDNAVAKSFFKTLKSNLVYQTYFYTRKQAAKKVVKTKKVSKKKAKKK